MRTLTHASLTKEPPVKEDGHEYAQRWSEGARSLEELDPDVWAWVKSRQLMRWVRTLFWMACASGWAFILGVWVGAHAFR